MLLRINNITDIKFDSDEYIPVSDIKDCSEHMILSVQQDKPLYKIRVIFNRINKKSLEQVVPCGSLNQTDDNTVLWEAEIYEYHDVIPLIRRYAAISKYDNNKQKYVPCVRMDKEACPELYNILKDDFRRALSYYEN